MISHDQRPHAEIVPCTPRLKLAEEVPLNYNKGMIQTRSSSIALGVYQHYKGNLYEVLNIAQHSETSEWLVVYRQLYGDHSVWVRPLEMFQETVDTGTGPQQRFRLVEEEEFTHATDTVSRR